MNIDSILEVIVKREFIAGVVIVGFLIVMWIIRKLAHIARMIIMCVLVFFILLFFNKIYAETTQEPLRGHTFSLPENTLQMYVADSKVTKKLMPLLAKLHFLKQKRILESFQETDRKGLYAAKKPLRKSSTEFSSEEKQLIEKQIKPLLNTMEHSLGVSRKETVQFAWLTHKNLYDDTLFFHVYAKHYQFKKEK